MQQQRCWHHERGLRGRLGWKEQSEGKQQQQVEHIAVKSINTGCEILITYLHTRAQDENDYVMT
jgi:hypothetical protein